MELLTKFFPLFTSEKVFLSLYIIVFVLSFWMVMNHAQKENIFLVSFIFLFIYNWTVFLGFYQYILSIPVFFFTLLFFIRNPELNTLNQIFIFNVLLLLLFYSHIISLAAFILTALVIEYLKRGYIKSLLIFCLKMLPVLVLFLAANLFYSTGKDFKPLYSSFWNILLDISRWFYYYNIIDRLVFIIVFLFEFYIALRIIKDKFYLRKEYFSAAVLLFIIYLITPKAFYNDAWFINIRLVPYFLLLPLLSFNKKVDPAFKHVFLLTIVAVSIITAIHIYNIFEIENRRIEQYTEGIKLVHKNPKVLPLTAKNAGRTNPLLHAWAYYNIKKGGVSPFSFAVAGFHPVEFKHRPVEEYLPSPGESSISFLNSKMLFSYDYVFLSGNDKAVDDLLKKNYFKKIFSNEVISIWQNPKDINTKAGSVILDDKEIR